MDESTLAERLSTYAVASVAASAAPPLASAPVTALTSWDTSSLTPISSRLPTNSIVSGSQSDPSDNEVTTFHVPTQTEDLPAWARGEARRKHMARCTLQSDLAVAHPFGTGCELCNINGIECVIVPGRVACAYCQSHDASGKQSRRICSLREKSKAGTIAGPMYGRTCRRTPAGSTVGLAIPNKELRNGWSYGQQPGSLRAESFSSVDSRSITDFQRTAGGDLGSSQEQLIAFGANNSSSNGCSDHLIERVEALEASNLELRAQLASLRAEIESPYRHFDDGY